MSTAGVTSPEMSTNDVINVESRGLYLNGSLEITRDDTDISSCDTTLEIDQLSIDRGGQFQVAEPTYYIKHNVDINEVISINKGGSTCDGQPECDGQNDDAWRVETTLNVSCDSPSFTASNINLPVGTSTYTVATITVCDHDGPNATNATVQMKVDSDATGNLTTSWIYNTFDIVGRINDDIRDAQFAYFTESTKPTAPNENDADRLKVLLQNADLADHFSDKRDELENTINNKNLIASYTMELTQDTEFSTTSDLSKFAAERNATTNDPFVVGDQVVLSGAHTLDYGLTVDGDNSTENDFTWEGANIDKVNVYGILVHTVVNSN